MKKSLAITVQSFSFRQGYPPVSEHGGGFVFDCRCLPNPGKEERYKKMTGRDPAVIEFLEGEEDVRQFRGKVFDLIDMAIEDYLRREFTDLMVSFGCTGGQHRSVYFAEQLTLYLKNRAHVKVKLSHLELAKLGFAI